MHVLAAHHYPAAFGWLIYAGVVLAYFLPSIIAVLRHLPNSGAVLIINLFLGWTVIFWFVALVMAIVARKPRPPQPVPVTFVPPPHSDGQWPYKGGWTGAPR